MNRARYKNIINKSKDLKLINPYDLFVKSLPAELDYYKDDNNYRLKAAWEAYGKPRNILEAWYEGLVDIHGNNLVMPSIGYNESTDTYEYLNKGRENETVNKDIKVWENDTIPFVKELKNGGYIRTFDEDLNCWMYLKGGKTKEKPVITKIVTYKETPTELVKLIYNSDANFAKRLVDPDRKYLDLENGSIGSHKLSYSTNDKGVVVYPEIQEINGKLIDLSNDRHAAYESAMRRGDYVIFPSEKAAEWFTADNYKRYFPGLEKYAPQAFKLGGQMNVIPEGALHAHKNHIEGAGEDFTTKGIPVVTESGELTAEIEREELILNKDNTDKIEDLYKKFFDEKTSESEKDELAIRAGKLLSKELVENTDDRAGVIEKEESK